MLRCRISRENLYKRIYNIDSAKQINPLIDDNEKTLKNQCSKVIVSMIRNEVESNE